MEYVKTMLLEENSKKVDKNIAKKIKDALVVVVLFFIVVVPAIIINPLFGIIAFFIWLFCIVMAKPGGKSYSYYRKNYRQRALEFLLQDVSYTFLEEAQIDTNVVSNSQMVGYYDWIKCQDKLSINIENDDGSNSGFYLNLCDLKAMRRESRSETYYDQFRQMDVSGRKEWDVLVYNGIFGYIELPFEFRCLMCINSNYKKKGVIVKNVVLEDAVFNKKFRIWCDDQIEARYILTPEMMEKLMVLSNKFKNIKMVLVDNRMYLGFEGSDLLELGDYKEEIITIFDDLYDDISAVLGLINEIRDNNKIFKM
jgi:hypothetical protein